MKLRNQLLGLLAGLVCSMAMSRIAMAGNDQNTGAVGQIITEQTIVYVYITGATYTASCATMDRYVIDLTQPGGKSMLATLLYIKSQGQQAIVFGAGTCNLSAQSEDMVWVATSS